MTLLVGLLGLLVGLGQLMSGLSSGVARDEKSGIILARRSKRPRWFWSIMALNGLLILTSLALIAIGARWV